MPKNNETSFGKEHVLVLDYLSDGKAHFPFRDGRIYDEETILCPNEVMERMCQLSSKDLPLARSSGGDAYFHGRITRMGKLLYQEVNVDSEKEFVNDREYPAVIPGQENTPEGIEAAKRLHELTIELGL
jgi:hypothetical protein